MGFKFDPEIFDPDFFHTVLMQGDLAAKRKNALAESPAAAAAASVASYDRKTIAASRETLERA